VNNFITSNLPGFKACRIDVAGARNAVAEIYVLSVLSSLRLI